MGKYTKADKKSILIQDEIEAEKPLDVEWLMHTNAQVEIKGDTALLSMDNRELRIQVLAPEECKWLVKPVDLQPPQRPTPDTRKLILQFRTTPPLTRIAVLLSGESDNAGYQKVTPLKALKDWPSVIHRQ